MTEYTTQGARLPSLERTITQEQIGRYAHAAGDFNPIHLDHEFAESTDFGGTIAHGMMVIAFISEMMTRAYGAQWPATGTLKLRLRAPTYPDDTLTAYGEVKRVAQQDGETLVTCAVGVRRPDGTVAISGDASVVVANGGAQ